VLDTQGNFISQLGTTLLCTDTSTTFCFPRSIAVDGADNLFVADTFNHKVKKYDANGNFLYSAGAYPQPSFPNSVRTAENGTFYVTDTGNSQVIRYTENATGTGATVANVIGTARTADGQFSEPTNILVGNDKRVYVSDKLNHRIQVFDENGNSLPSGARTVVQVASPVQVTCPVNSISRASSPPMRKAVFTWRTRTTAACKYWTVLDIGSPRSVDSVLVMASL
jgi:hypothetical protein